MSNIELVVFDWNGTLFNDVYTVVACDNIVLTTYNYSSVGIRKYRDNFRQPIIDHFEDLGFNRELFEQESDNIAQLFSYHYEKMALKCDLRWGAKKLLLEIARQGKQSIILSNHPAELIDIHLNRFKIKHLFSEISGNDNQKICHFKLAKEDRLKNYLEKHEIDPQNVIIIGDTIEEVEIGHNLGLYTAAISNGFCSKSRLKVCQPDHLITNLVQLIDIINGG